MNIYGKSNSCNNDLETLHKKKKFSNKDCFYKCDQIHSFLRIWSHLQKNGKFIFCAVEPCYDACYNKKPYSMTSHEQVGESGITSVL